LLGRQQNQGAFLAQLHHKSRVVLHPFANNIALTSLLMNWRLHVLTLIACCFLFLSARAVTLAPAQSATAAAGVDLSAAREAIRQAHWTEAERLARSYLSDHVASPEGHYLLAFALFRDNKPKDSLAEYTAAAKLQKPTATDLRWVALDYVLLHDYEDADKWMTTSLQWDSHDGDVWYEMGRIKYQENRFAEAVTAFENSLQRIPNLVKAEDNLGLALEGLNEPDKAIAAYRQAIAWQSGVTQKSAQPMLNLGILLSDQGHLDDALPLLLEAETISPDDSKIQASLGKLYLRQGNLASAQAQLEKAAAVDPFSASIHFQLGQVYRKEGKTDMARKEFERASQIDGASSSDKH
jgi:tetratricopeptide (TPR) repeat protein